MIKLSPRLEKISHYIKDNTSMVDIGCDHALLDVYLAQNKKNIKIIASDINPNALNNAKRNIKKYHLDDKIKTCLSKGLEKIDTSFIDTIIISGMGAHTMVGILYKDISKLKGIDTLILQSNNDLDFLRKKVVKLGYFIADEVLIKDSGIIYTIVIFKKGHKFYNKKQLYFGPILLKAKDKLMQEKNKKDLEKLEKFYPLIPKSKLHHRIITHWKIKNIKKILVQQ